MLTTSKQIQLSSNMSMRGKKMINTIGYEGVSSDAFVRTLKRSKISYLIDVRERAQSRRKGFSKTALAASLASEGIAYLHLRELGDPKLGREAARRGDVRAFQQIYAAVISAKAGREAVDTIIKVASENSVCLMCYERDPNTCHRKIITDMIEKLHAIKARHLEVDRIEHGKGSKRRVLHSRKGPATQVEQVL